MQRYQRQTRTPKTVAGIHWVLQRNVTEAQLKAILKDLQEVPGNAAFRALVQQLTEYARARI